MLKDDTDLSTLKLKPVNIYILISIYISIYFFPVLIKYILI